MFAFPKLWKSDFVFNSELRHLRRSRKGLHMKRSESENQSKFQSLLQTSYVNEVHELMHDPKRIITLPLGSKAGAISGCLKCKRRTILCLSLHPVCHSSHYLRRNYVLLTEKHQKCHLYFDLIS